MAYGFLQVRFSNNSAGLEGEDVYIYTMKTCRELKVQWNETALQDNEISQTIRSLHELALTGTVANYLKFDGVDTACVKPIGAVSWLLRDCKLSTLRLLHK